MEKVSVKTPGRSYDIIIGRGILDEAGNLSLKSISSGKALIITDSTVDGLYSGKLADSLQASGFSVEKYVIPAGESSKNTENLLDIVNFLAENNFTRSDTVFALGGGVVGDIAGFAASVYLRGINFVQIPTTLLAAVDSSVGGKTAVNLPSGKNLMGAFYQPNMVICDYSVFDTLSEEIFRDGCAEVIKYAMIFDSDFLERLKLPIKNNIEEVIKRCVSIKSHIVEMDEKDNAERQLLNFGHTFGHAIEKCSGYSISHGKAVAIGMAMITRASVKKEFCTPECLSALMELLNAFELPCSTEFSVDELYKVLLSDKKRKGDKINLVVPEKAGRCVLKKFPVADVRELLEAGM